MAELMMPYGTMGTETTPSNPSLTELVVYKKLPKINNKKTDFGVFFLRKKLIMNLSKIFQVTADYILLQCIFIFLLGDSPQQRCCECQQWRDEGLR